MTPSVQIIPCPSNVKINGYIKESELNDNMYIYGFIYIYI